MSQETLGDLYGIKTRTLGDLDLDAKDRIVSPSKYLYDFLLVHSSLWDAEGNYWIESIWYPNTRRTYHLWSDVQLLGLIAVSPFKDEDYVGYFFETLSDDPLYDEEQRLWIKGRHDEMGWNRTTPLSAQYLGIIAEAMVDRESARNKYESLKDTVLYKQEAYDWEQVVNSGVVDQGTSESGYPYLASLSILVEALSDRDLAKRHYDILKNKYQRTKQGFLFSRNNNIEDKQIVRCTEELLSIWLDAVFDRETAVYDYDRLKTTSLHDPRTGLWFRWLNLNPAPRDINHPNVCDSIDQLIGLILENLVERK